MGQKQIAVRANNLRRVSASITRPANVTAYTAADAISAATGDAHFEFVNPLVLGENTGEILSAIITSSANVGTKPDVELFLFHTDVTAIADNAAWTPTDAELATTLGVIDFPVANWKQGHNGADAAGNSLCQAMNLAHTFNLAKVGDGTRPSIYGQLVARNAYVPVSAEVFTIELLIRQD